MFRPARAAALAIVLVSCIGCTTDSGTNDAEKGTIPISPSNLAAESSSSRIDLTWKDNSANEDGFIIERKPDGGEYSRAAAVPANTVGCSDSGLTAGTYTYRVMAYRGSEYSAYSNEASATLSHPQKGTIIIDHTCARLSQIPDQWITQAKKTLHIAYGHTSHGSQIVTGMEGLVQFKGALYSFTSGGAGGALDLRDTPFSGAYDLGNPDWTSWCTATRTYLNAHPEVNVIVWSWCGEVSNAAAGDIETYLSLMSKLEQDYPNVRFVYMTGHLDGSGLTGNLHMRNEQIRAYCRANSKVLYDFADMESWNPDGVYFGDKKPNDNCDYNDGVRTGNWAEEWQNTHAKGVDWYECSAAHTKPLNANLKAYAAWWLWARLAGWE
jgi:hypothetical protein